MPDGQEDLSSRIEALERTLRIREKAEISRAAGESARTRQRALRLEDRSDVTTMAGRIAALAGKRNVLIEWTARDVDPELSAARGCCCCCCCCCQSAEIALGQPG